MSQTETQSEPETGRSLTSLVDEVQQTTDQEVISVGDLLDQFESQSYGPLLLVFGFLALSPVGAIPGMSLLLGTIIILIALQILYGKDHPWLPERILKIEFPGKKLSRVIKKLKPWASWIQTFLKQRLVWLTNSPGLRFLALICIFLAISFY
ncbi:MAG: exopolysaccharide biosynthesis protein, partial [Planctomycetaceae bacterium]|nr:exopolysaccharide biosynthesis protein [Planctomycetaceae bacterium]